MSDKKATDENIELEDFDIDGDDKCIHKNPHHPDLQEINNLVTRINLDFDKDPLNAEFSHAKALSWKAHFDEAGIPHEMIQHLYEFTLGYMTYDEDIVKGVNIVHLLRGWDQLQEIMKDSEPETSETPLTEF